MNEKGIDISNEAPRKLTNETGLRADVIVTMGCGDASPVYPGKRYLDWDLVDPAGKDVEMVRQIRDDIERRVRDLLADLLKITAQQKAKQ
jgi:protein-tyrosine-phosphatase